MENSAGRLTSTGFEEMIMFATGPSASTDVISNFHTAVEACNLSSLDEVALDNHSDSPWNRSLNTSLHVWRR